MESLESKSNFRRLPYVESLYSRSDLPPTHLYGSNWAHKIADFFVFALYLLYYCFYSFGMDSIFGESYPLTALMSQTGVIK